MSSSIENINEIQTDKVETKTTTTSPSTTTTTPTPTPTTQPTTTKIPSNATDVETTTFTITTTETTDRNGKDDKEEKERREKEHSLQYTYSLWFNRRVQGARTQENYEKNIKKVASFATVEEFWNYYSHLVRPNDLPNTSDYHLFKDGIKPMWEDDANKSGGKWILRLRKGQASRYWEDLVLAVIGEQFDVGGEICGAVVSVRYQEDILSVWNRNATDSEAKNRILETMKRVLPLEGSSRFEYKNHDASIRDNSSFRNTDPLFVPSGPSPSYSMRRDSRDMSRDTRDTRDRIDRFAEKSDRGDRFAEKSDRGDRFADKGERMDRYSDRERSDRFERGDRFGDKSDRDRFERDRGDKGAFERERTDIRSNEKSDRSDWNDRDRDNGPLDKDQDQDNNTSGDKWQPSDRVDSSSNRRPHDKQPLERRPFSKKPRVPIHQPSTSK